MVDWDAGEVLEHGVPPVPAALPPGNEVPVARWLSGDVGAVLSLFHDPNDEVEPYTQDIEILRRGPDGVWMPGTKGGSDWPVKAWGRPTIPRPELSGFASGTALVGGGYLWVASGIAPVGVDQVCVVDGAYDEIVEVEPVTGAFLVPVETIDGDVKVIALPDGS